MAQDLLDSDARVRIASLLYKLAIRTLKLSKRSLPPEQVAPVLDKASSGKLNKLISFFNPPGGKGKGPSIAKVLAVRSLLQGEGEGIRLDLVFGPIRLLEQGGDIGAVTSKTDLQARPPQGLLDLDRLQTALVSVMGGTNPQLKLITSDVRDVLDRPFRIDHSYAKDLGVRAWKVLHNGGPRDGQVALYESPEILAQIESQLEARRETNATEAMPDIDLDPYRPAVFRSAEDASVVLNQLTRGTSVGSRNIPKFIERTIYVKYSSAYSKAGEPDIYSALDQLISSADSEASQKSKLSAEEREALVDKAIVWIKEREVSPTALLSTLQAKNPELAKKYLEVLPELEARLSLLEQEDGIGQSKQTA